MKKLLLAAKHDLAFQRPPASFCFGNVNQDQTPIPGIYITAMGRFFFVRDASPQLQSHIPGITQGYIMFSCNRAS